MTTLSPYRIPTYLLQRRPNLDERGIVEYVAGYWDATQRCEVETAVSWDDWHATLSEHRDHVNYSDGGNYYDFDIIAAQGDTEARDEEERELMWLQDADLSQTYAYFMGGASLSI